MNRIRFGRFIVAVALLPFCALFFCAGFVLKTLRDSFHNGSRISVAYFDDEPPS